MSFKIITSIKKDAHTLQTLLQTEQQMLLLDLQRYQANFHCVSTAAPQGIQRLKDIFYPVKCFLKQYLSISSKISSLICYRTLIYSNLEHLMENSYDYIVIQIPLAGTI